MARAADSNDISARRWSSAPAVRWFTGGQGRPAAIALAVLLAVFHISLSEPAWSPIRNLLFDAYQRLMPRQISRYPVVIVDIDDASLATLGRWPWPRTRLARLIEATHRSGALAVGIDIIMPEADSLSPGGLLVDRQDVIRHCRVPSPNYPPTNTILAQTLRRIPTVIARAAIADGEVETLPKRSNSGRCRR